MKKLLFGLAFFWSWGKTEAQSPPPDSLRIWVETEIVDSLQQVTISPRFLNSSSLPGYFYWQLRLHENPPRFGKTSEKITGLVFAPPGDTIELLRKTLPFSSDKDFNALVFIFEEEFVVAHTQWNFLNEYAAHKKLPAKQKTPQPFLANDDFEIDALVFNETRTPFGREFFRQFTENWEPPKGVSGYWITIRETLTPGRQTLLSVNLNNRELFQRYLVPRPDYISDLVQQTVQYLTSLLQNGQYDGSLTTEDLFGKL